MFKKFSAVTLCLVLIALPVFVLAQKTDREDKNAFTLNPKDYTFRTNVHSPEQFEGWRQEVLSFYRKVVRIEPSYKPLPLETVYTETVKVYSNVTRHRIEYNTTDNLRIPAYLFVPKTKTPVPVVIVYHGHGDGKINAAGLEGTNENALAKWLTEKLGYVALAPDARSFGEFQIPGFAKHPDYYSALLSKGQLYMSKLLEDSFQDMALLRSIKEADISRLGVAGISMGSWRALNTGVLHNEVRATVVAGLFIPWDYLFSWAHCRCQHIPRFAKRMKMEDLAATLFPRDLMIQWGQKDTYYKQDAEKLIEHTQGIAKFLGYSDHFTVDRHPEMGHRFSNSEVALFFHNKLGDGAWTPQW